VAAPPPALDDATLWRICEILADTGSGLTNAELDRLLREARVTDPTPRTAGPGTAVMVSKRERLHRALSASQRRDGHGAGVLRFVKLAMQPARYTATPELFEDRRHELNVTLSFVALRLEEDGSLVRVRAASTLTDARRRAKRLRQTLADRNAHHRLLAACVDEIRDENYFHAVLEATKSLAEEIRRKTGLTGDGVPLVDSAFDKSKVDVPLLALNTLRTQTERSRQKGLADGLRAVFAAARNPTAHEPKALGTLTELDALDHLTQVSYLHRRLDECTPTAHLTSGP
jgi:uncharacterized protein (TIGR02391 family)